MIFGGRLASVRFLWVEDLMSASIESMRSIWLSFKVSHVEFFEHSETSRNNFRDSSWLVNWVMHVAFIWQYFGYLWYWN